MSRNLRKLIDIGPNGVIVPGSAQDYRYHDNPRLVSDARTGWIRLWAPWQHLQPDQRYAIDDPRSPGYFRLQSLDAQIRQACTNGLRVMLVPYCFPTWANGLDAVRAAWNTDAEISYRYWDRMAGKEWRAYEAAGRNPAAYNPKRKALEYGLPNDAYGPSSHWARFFEFLYRRYHYGQRSSGRYVHAFDLVNEPNGQLWPMWSPPPADNPFSKLSSTLTITGQIARLLATAQGISARYGHSTTMLAPSLSDSDNANSRMNINYATFVPGLLDAMAAIGYRPHANQGWSHHNYADTQERLAGARLQEVRGLLRGRWTGMVSGQAPTVWVTEGGAQVRRMTALYPTEDPLQAQAKCLRDAIAQHSTDTGAGEGVAMLCQYLLYADPNFDCGLLDPWPSTTRRPAFAAWAAYPRYQ
jgi:hypothetical protein